MSGSIRISDHAVLKYLERVEGVDVEAVRRRIARHARVAVESELSGATHIRFDGFQICVANDVATTILAPHPDKIRKRKPS